MGRVLLALIALLVISMAFGAGWVARGWNDGSTTTTGKADADAQESVKQGASASVMVSKAKDATNAAVNRVQVVEVAADCPPGQGAMSAKVEVDVRSALRE